MKDERVQKTVQSVGTRVFGLWFILLCISLLYRSVYLRQPIGEFWDILAIFLIGSFFASFSMVSQGVISDDQNKRQFKVIAPTIAMSMTMMRYFLGSRDFIELALTFVAALVGSGLMYLLFAAIYRRWDKGI